MQELLSATGANTGNLLIGNGLFNSLDCEEKSYHPGFGVIPPDRLHEHYDAVFIPASNFVNNAHDMGQPYDYFSRTKLSLVCFGLGSQLLPDQEIALKPGTERFLRLIGERSGSIGVRGAFTAEVMWKLGIRNVSIVGCPSLLSLTENALERLSSDRPSLDKVSLNFSNNVRRHAVAPDAMQVSENSLFQRMLTENAFYIVQNEAPEIELLGAMDRGEPADAAVVNRIATIFGAPATSIDVQRFLTQRLRVFFSVDQWVACMKTMTSSVGTRFHGNFAAMLAGTPALFLVHDMRTLELCELLRVPHVVLDREFTAEELVERLLASDYQPFRRQFRELLTEWRLFLHRNGLSVSSAAGEESLVVGARVNVFETVVPI